MKKLVTILFSFTFLLAACKPATTNPTSTISPTETVISPTSMAFMPTETTPPTFTASPTPLTAPVSTAAILEELGGYPCPNSEFTCVDLEVPLDHFNPANDEKTKVVFGVLPATGESKGMFVTASGDLRVVGTYDSVPFSHTYRIEFFANQACDPSGYGEGERFLGFADLTTDVAGRVVIDITNAQSGVGAGQFVTATATDEAGNTSEFSRCVETQFGTDLTIDAGSSSTELTVSDTRGFLVGDLIRINPGGANQEDNRIVGFGSILLATPLQFDHMTGEPVILLSKHLYLSIVTK